MDRDIWLCYRGVQHVVNYDLPKSIDEYVHRIGRTGRLGNTGRATSFFDGQQDSGLAGDLVRVLADSHQVRTLWKLSLSNSNMLAVL